MADDPGDLMSRPAGPESVIARRAAFPSGYVLETDVAPAAETLRILAPDGRICLKVTLTPEGPVLELSGVSLAVSAQRDIQIDCERLDIRARQALSLHTGGDLSLTASGELRSEALAQHHEATLGDLEMHANDDVMLHGERIRLNSPRTPTELAARARLGAADE